MQSMKDRQTVQSVCGRNSILVELRRVMTDHRANVVSSTTSSLSLEKRYDLTGQQVIVQKDERVANPVIDDWVLIPQKENGAEKGR